jgi:branched-chain amino acid transport system substrate-binding protein
MIKTHFLKILLVGVSVLLVFIWFGVKNSEKEKVAEEAIHIAVIGPMTGTNASEGTSFMRGAELYLDEINASGGINGKQLVLDKFDDENDPKKASEGAQTIVDENRAVAVIGHYYSSCSIAGGKIYAEQGIPAITPASTTVDVTLDNPWYFRTVFNDKLQGQFLAHYLKKVLKQNVVSIIHEDLTYGAYLASVFEESAQQLNIEIKYKRGFQTRSENLDETLTNIVNELKDLKEESGFIFLATQATEGTKLVRLIKDAGIQNKIIVPAAFDSDSFKEGFKEYPKERLNPGYYSDGIYITTPFIFDTANDKAQKFKETYRKKYQEKANMRTAFAYDTAKVIVEAIKANDIQGNAQTIKDDRKKIRNYLTSLNSVSFAIEGTTGFNYFDANGDAQKPVAIGVFKDKIIISALMQLQEIRDLGEISDLKTALKEERVLLIDGRSMYKTNVVYVGVKINEIDDIDVKTATCTLDFYIWFRFLGDIDMQEIEFLNAVTPIKLHSPVKEETLHHMTRKLYRVKDSFKMDFLSSEMTDASIKRYTPQEHVLGIKIRHRDLTRNNLIYVTDVLGMGLTNSQRLVEKMRKEQVLNPKLSWTIDQIWLSQNVGKATSLGSLKYLNASGGQIEFSEFNVGVLVKSAQLTLRNTFSIKSARILSVICTIMMFLLVIAFKHPKSRFFPKTIWFLQVIFTFTLLLAIEMTIMDWMAEETTLAKRAFITRLFDMLWWITPAILLHWAAELFLWTPLEEKSGRAIPRIVRRFVSSTIYIITVLGIVAFVYDQRLTSLLATSGVIAMIIGLAIQINISNIFSGIAINIEHPFRVGDWVKIGTFEEGRVLDVTWRTTRIMTRMGCVLSIPNSTASESIIHNFDYPDSVYWLRFIVHIHPSHPPARVKKIIYDAVISTKEVVKKPEPFVIFTGLSEWSADYLCYFAVEDYTWRLLHEEAVWTRIWIHLNRAGISPAIQRQEIHLFKGVQERGEESATSPLTLLQEIDIFRPFSDGAKNYLSDKIRTHRLSANDTIFEEGAEGASLFIVVEGVVGVRVQSKEEKGQSVEVARLGAGSFFGEMALLTGESRTATILSLTDTVLFEITKEDIAELMAKQPEVTELISEVLVRRQSMTKSQMNVKHDVKIEEEALYKRLLGKIETWLSKP